MQLMCPSGYVPIFTYKILWKWDEWKMGSASRWFCTLLMALIAWILTQFIRTITNMHLYIPHYINDEPNQILNKYANIDDNKHITHGARVPGEAFHTHNIAFQVTLFELRTTENTKEDTLPSLLSALEVDPQDGPGHCRAGLGKTRDSFQCLFLGTHFTGTYCSYNWKRNSNVSHLISHCYSIGIEGGRLFIN